MKLLEVPPYPELTTGELVRQTLKWQVVGLALLAAHVVLSKLSIALFFPLGLLALGWRYHRAPLAGLLVFFQWLIYQNWVLSILSVGMDYTTFTMLQGSSFAALALMAIVSFARLASLKRWRHLNGRLLGAVKLALFMSCIYALYGMTKAGVTPTAVYFREATSLVLAVPIGLDVGRVWGYRTVGAGFLLSAALSIAISLVEIAAPTPYYEAINAANYTNLKYSKLGSSIKDPNSISTVRSARELAEFNSQVLFNVTGSESTLKSFRFLGTVIHSVSYGYILAGCAVVAMSIGAAQWLWILLPLLVMIGVKGANLLFACSLLLWLVWSVTRSRNFLLTSGFIMMVGYVGFGLYFGMDRGDFHVIGFLGGVKGLMANPIGHGLGMGGNFSPEAMRYINWEVLQHFGADFAVESAVGVLIYQMGIASITIFAVIVLLLRDAPFGDKGPQRRDIALIGLAAVTINGIFQEEAYTSYACGLFTLLSAVIVANGYRAATTWAANQQRLSAYLPRRVAA
jgi:hypothetical protein